MNVLLVEDNPGDARLTKEAFKTTDNEIEFHTVTDGKEATEYVFQREELDIILLDLNLPRMDGFTFLEQIKRELDYPPPVLVLSSSKTESDIRGSYERAANAYLTKPQSPDEFDTMAQAIEDFWIESAQHPPAPS
ncbi:response regulator [Natrialba sp. INN-245]|nr:response regulator [Natrialba sp. INN-245]